MDGIQCRVCWRIVVQGDGAIRPDGSFMCEKCREIASLDHDHIVVPKHADWNALRERFMQWNGEAKWSDADPVMSSLAESMAKLEDAYSRKPGFSDIIPSTLAKISAMAFEIW